MLTSLEKRTHYGYTHTSDEWRDECYFGLSTGNSLTETEEKSEIAVDSIVTLEFTSSLDTLPCGSDLDQDTLLLDADRVVESDELFCLGLGSLLVKG